MADDVVNTQDTNTVQEPAAVPTPEVAAPVHSTPATNDPWASFAESMKNAGYTPDQVLATIKGNAAQRTTPVADVQPTTPNVPGDIAEIVRAEIARNTGEQISRIASVDHRERASQEQGVAKSIVETNTKNLDPAEANIAKRLFEAEVASTRKQSLYPEGHPLAEQYFKPLTKEQVEAAWSKVSSELNAVRASNLGRIGRAANRIAPAVGGNGTNNAPAPTVPGRQVISESDLAAARAGW
jgi:hypothetical protein